MLAGASINLALDYKCAVLFDVDNVYLDYRSMDIHDGKRLLPIRRSLGVSKWSDASYTQIVRTAQTLLKVGA